MWRPFVYVMAGYGMGMACINLLELVMDHPAADRPPSVERIGPVQKKIEPAEILTPYSRIAYQEMPVVKPRWFCPECREHVPGCLDDE
jgi:hypothetical protein